MKAQEDPNQTTAPCDKITGSLFCEIQAPNLLRVQSQNRQPLRNPLQRLFRLQRKQQQQAPQVLLLPKHQQENLQQLQRHREEQQ